MSFAIDVNILVYASDTGSRFHDPAVGLLHRCASGSDVFYLTWPTIMGYLAIATHAAVFARPLSPDEAMRNIDGLLALPHARVLTEDEGFWDLYRETAGAVPLRGNLVPDAHVATLLRQHGVRDLYTHDRDFRRFDFLRVIDPFEAKAE